MNIQEEFNFLISNLSEKNEEQGADIIAHLRRALTNVINSFITDFDKMSQNSNQNKVHLPPIFTMIGLYIEKHTELFICQDGGIRKLLSEKSPEKVKINKKTVEQGSS